PAPAGGRKAVQSTTASRARRHIPDPPAALGDPLVRTVAIMTGPARSCPGDAPATEEAGRLGRGRRLRRSSSSTTFSGAEGACPNRRATSSVGSCLRAHQSETDPGIAGSLAPSPRRPNRGQRDRRSLVVDQTEARNGDPAFRDEERTIPR